MNQDNLLQEMENLHHRVAAQEAIPGGEKIQLVDDEELVRHSGKRILERNENACSLERWQKAL